MTTTPSPVSGATILKAWGDAVITDLNALSALITTLDAKVVGKVKTADETVNNTASPQNDDHLTGFPYEIGGVYVILAWLIFTGVDQTADFRTDFATSPGTTGALASSSFYAQPTTATTGSGTVDTGAILDSSAANSSDHTRGTIAGTLSGLLVGVLYGATSTGTLTLRWAQGTAGATNLVLEKSSWMVMIKIA